MWTPETGFSSVSVSTWCRLCNGGAPGSWNADITLSPNMKIVIKPQQVILKIDGREIALALVKPLAELSKGGHMKFH